MCIAGSRLYVQEGIYDELEKKLVEKAKAWVVGDPFDPNVHQGPQVIFIKFDFLKIKISFDFELWICFGYKSIKCSIFLFFFSFWFGLFLG